MKSFIAIFSLIALVASSAAGGMGEVILCTHMDGETHRVTPQAHEAEGHGECSHHHEDSDHAACADDDLCCNPCTDTEIKLEELDEGSVKIERSLTKSPNAAPIALSALDETLIGQSSQRILQLPVRGPPDGASATLAMVKATVLRI